MNWVDTPLLVYAEVDGHPAQGTASAVLQQEPWGSSILVLLEFWQTLQRNYMMESSQATVAAERLLTGPGRWVELESTQVEAAFRASGEHRLSTTDVILLRLAQADRGTLVTLDQRLLRAAEAEGITTQNPIAPELTLAVAHWEQQNFPAKGISRLLVPVERWLRGKSPELADDFIVASASLKELPS